MGSIKGDFYDAAIIPSFNTHEILITGTEVKSGYYSLNLYSTDTFKPTAHFTNTDVVMYHPVSEGYFNGDQKKPGL